MERSTALAPNPSKHRGCRALLLPRQKQKVSSRLSKDSLSLHEGMQTVQRRHLTRSLYMYLQTVTGSSPLLLSTCFVLFRNQGSTLCTACVVPLEQGGFAAQQQADFKKYFFFFKAQQQADFKKYFFFSNNFNGSD